MTIEKKLESIHQNLILKQKKLALAESCTGGMLAAIITSQAGSSGWFDRAYITYSNQSKVDLLAVSEASLEHYGAVSEQVAREMAYGCLLNSGCNFALSITGIAGPGGGSIEKPVGTVWFALARYNKKLNRELNKQIEVIAYLQNFEGDRQQIREKAVYYALTQLKDFINQ